jgi:hypothetical protein
MTTIILVAKRHYARRIAIIDGRWAVINHRLAIINRLWIIGHRRRVAITTNINA